MLKDNEPLGDLVKCLLIHMKCIEVRLQYATHQYKGNSKFRIGASIARVKKAIDDICDLSNNPEVVSLIKKSLEKADLVYHMVLAEQLYDADETTLLEVTELIDKYLLEKHEKKLGDENSTEN